jgi:hypothetical protein
MDALTPLPGDPATLLSRAEDLDRSAAEIQLAIQNLRRLADHDETISKAISKVRDDVSDVASNVTKAHVRYTGTAAALREYAPKLEAAQGRAERAIAAYHSAGADVASAQHRLQTAQDEYTPDDGSVPPNAYARDAMFASTPEGVRSQHAVQEAQAGVANAQREWAAALADMTHAAQHAASLIDAAMDASGLNDGFWDVIGGAWDEFAAWAKKYLGPILDVLQKIAAQIANIAGILALVFGILGVFFPALEGIAGIFEMISLVASLVSFACTLILAVMGDRTWGDVLSTGIVAVTACLGSSAFGGGETSIIGSIGSKVGSKLEGTVAGGIVGRTTASLAGDAADEVAAQGGTFLQQALASGAVQDAMVGTIYNHIATEGADLLSDEVGINAGGYLDHATGQERPEGLWTTPPMLTPAVNFSNIGTSEPVFEPGSLAPDYQFKVLAENITAPLYIVGAMTGRSFESPLVTG